LIGSWDDENSGNQNSYIGSLPDGEYGGSFGYVNTQMYYCTYGPSFRILSFNLNLNLFFNIKSKLVPFSPTNLKLTQKTSTSVGISWTASAGSGVYYKITTSSTTTKYSSTSKTWNSLSPSTTYTFYIYAGKNNPSGGAETYETVGMIMIFFFFFF